MSNRRINSVVGEAPMFSIITVLEERLYPGANTEFQSLCRRGRLYVLGYLMLFGNRLYLKRYVYPFR